MAHFTILLVHPLLSCHQLGLVHVAAGGLALEVVPHVRRAVHPAEPAATTPVVFRINPASVILLSEFVQRALGVAHDGLVVKVVLHHHEHEPHQDHEAGRLHGLCESVLRV